MEKFITKNEKETIKLAKVFAREILKFLPESKFGIVVGFQGNLGAGKTTFIKGLVRGLGIKKRLTSPTFILMKQYNTRKGISVYHFDCYRLSDPKDILELGFLETVKKPRTLILIEWAEKIRKILPRNKIWISFKILGKNVRLITFLQK